MTTKTIYLLTLLFLTCGQNSAENKSVETESRFSLTISTYNHAEQIFNGTLSYELTGNFLTISSRALFSVKDTILLRKPVNASSMNQIQNISLDSLNDFYFNNCVALTSGNEYYILTTNDTVKRTIHLHHYYIDQIEMLINELNKQIPDNLKIKYLTRETKQDCK